MHGPFHNLSHMLSVTLLWTHKLFEQLINKQ